jgi:hypothetical protein
MERSWLAPPVSARNDAKGVSLARRSQAKAAGAWRSGLEAVDHALVSQVLQDRAWQLAVRLAPAA